MRRLSSSPLSFPDFRGATRWLVLANLAVFFALLVVRALSPFAYMDLLTGLVFHPAALLHGALWQPFSYSFVHGDLGSTFFELLSLWFLAGFLENLHPTRWLAGLYATSVLGAAAAATVLYAAARLFGGTGEGAILAGCFGGIFGLTTAIGLLHGDTEFLLFFTFNIKARYMAAIYILATLAMLFSQQRLYAFSQLGGALAGALFAGFAPRKGMGGLRVSESWYGLVNKYYRWKRRRAGRKFEVYMRSQGKTIRVDGYGRPIRKDDDPEDRSRWN